MGFLSKDVKAGEYVSVISEQCQFQGTLDLQGSLRIDGALEGNVDNAKYVTVSKTGTVKGDITAQGVVIIGKMTGDIVADSVEILADAKITGNIRSKSILIEGGAKVSATIHVVGEEEASLDEEEIAADEPKKAEEPKKEVKTEKKDNKKGDK
ncbi:bactofilin family protein [Candidatus Proelusimicrobium excrementi]|uniref:bactofilin family protein n=1 Tax=Candidatus Proelusimicrobium excrementi TaxID=3416222 RepID=UPI003D105CA0